MFDIEFESSRLLVNVGHCPRDVNVSALAGVNLEVLGTILSTERN